ncbi:MAG: hypothetical protein Tsb0020_08100 [Haliangiales bacterium]
MPRPETFSRDDALAAALGEQTLPEETVFVGRDEHGFTGDDAGEGERARAPDSPAAREQGAEREAPPRRLRGRAGPPEGLDEMPRRVGRFVILRELGRGGMGVAYLAYDDQLDRNVAVKLVRPNVDADTAHAGQERLLREAKTLARLTHPNIVGVHDVGTYGAQVYIAMEFVKGRTLLQWRTVKRRDWRETVKVFCQAGAGLMAAHSAGLVHRDFKPANVIVGDDGRVRVLDFGLARNIADAGDYSRESGGELGAGGSLSRQVHRSAQAPARPGVGTLTKSGDVLGTIGYAAPEQFASSSVTAAADQFAFCVSLYESLYERLPFPGENGQELRQAILAGRVRDAPRGGRPWNRTRVPSWLHAVILRGLRAEPSERWPSMASLIEALQRDPARRRRGWAMGGVGVALLAAASAGTWGLTSRIDMAAVCSGGDEQLTGVWDQQRRDTVRASILATEAPHAASTWTHVEHLLDSYSESWRAAHRDACEATAVRKEQSAETLDLRMACLSSRRRALEALVEVLSDVEAGGVSKAALAISQLPHIDSCADPSYLQARVAPPEEPLRAELVKALRGKLARARELDNLGKIDAAWTLINEVSRAAQGLDYVPLQAELAALRGLVELDLGRLEDARQSFYDAYFMARESSHDEIALEASSMLVFIVGHNFAKFDEAYLWARLGEAELAHSGSDEHRVRLLNRIGALRKREGKYEQASEYFGRAAELAERMWAGENYYQASVAHNLGAILFIRGIYDQAEVHLRRALVIREQIVGPEHPDVGFTLAVMGQIALVRGRPEQAERHWRRARELYERAGNINGMQLSEPYFYLGELYYQQRRYRDAAELLKRAVAERERGLGRDHFWVAEVLAALAPVTLALGDVEAAQAQAQRAVAILERGKGEPVMSADAFWALALTLDASGEEPQRALELANRARAIYAAQGGESQAGSVAEIDAWLSARGTPAAAE